MRTLISKLDEIERGEAHWEEKKNSVPAIFAY